MIDLREYLEVLEKHGELLTVKEEVDWNLEVGAYASMSSRAGAKAIHFKKVTGCSNDISLATNLFSGPPLLDQWDDLSRQPWKRIALGLGLEPKIRYEEMQTTILDRIGHPIFPIEVKESACKEVIRTGDKINLLELPLPFLHQEDGGRYGSGHILVMKDPESTWHDWSVCRWTPIGPNTLVVGFERGGNDARQIIDKYFAQGKPAPFAIALGGPPAIIMAATMTMPERISEVDAAGGLNLDPIRLVKAETGNFFVPADAEVVIEGEFIPGEMAEEGPYGAFFGYTKREKRPVGVVKAMTRRQDAILPVVVDGTHPCDTEWLISIFESARLLEVCTRRAMHPVKWINVVPDYGLGVCIISVRNYYPGVAFTVARWVFVHSNLFDKIIFVDEDLVAVSLWAVHNRIMNRTHPSRATHRLEGFPATSLQWYVTKEEVDCGIGAGRVYIDTCWPAHWGKEDVPTAVCYEVTWSKEVRAKIIRRWKEYGFKEEPLEMPEGKVFEG